MRLNLRSFLNPISNNWSILNRRVLSNGKKYDSFKELNVVIKKTWYPLLTKAFQKPKSFKENTILLTNPKI